MAIDVLNFPDLQNIERQIIDREMREDIGAYHTGNQVSQKVGYGLEMDGLREYTPGDDARHIDWIRTAAQGDGTILWRKHYAERAPLTVIVSDMASHERYAGTIGHPASARTLGYIAANIVAVAASQEQSPVMTLWSNGYDFDRDISIFEGPNTGELALNDGFRAGLESSERIKLKRIHEERTTGLFRKKNVSKYIMPEQEKFVDLLHDSTSIAQRYAEAARFIVISGFEGNSEDVIEQLELMKNRHDVVAIQVTHPLMRELPKDVTEISIGDGKSIQIESDAQRTLYTARARARLENVQSGLKSATQSFIELDTNDPKLSALGI